MSDGYTPTQPRKPTPPEPGAAGDGGRLRQASQPAPHNGPPPSGSPVHRRGERLLDRYEVFGYREGSAGIVYFLRDLRENRNIAAKTWKTAGEAVAGAGTDQADALEAFRAEVGFWIELDRHPNILQAYRVELIAGRPYLLMEYVEGGTNLRDLLKHEVPRAAAVQLMYQLCLGLEAASRRYEVAHLDLKPENLLVTQEGILKITDFTISSPVRPNRGLIPRPAAGSWPYAAPERFLDLPEDSRSDVYSCGVIFHELLTRRLPYPPYLNRWSGYEAFESFHRAEHMREIARRIYYQGIPEINEAGTNIILGGCLDPYREYRFPRLRELREALEAAYGLEPPAYLREFVEAEQDLRTQAINYYRIGQYGRAQELLNQALLKAPGDARLWLEAGRVLLAQRFTGEARGALERAVRLDPGLKEEVEELVGNNLTPGPFP